MDKAFLEDQKKKMAEYLEQSPEPDADEKRKVAIVYQFISSLLDPDLFTTAEHEDIRKLALELGYEEKTDFSEWLKSSSTAEEKGVD